MEDYRKAFSLLDIDSNGEITKADLDSFMRNKLGEEPTETELQEMITGSLFFPEIHHKNLQSIEVIQPSHP